MPCDPINCGDVTEKVFECLRKKLAQEGINIPKGKNSGKVKTDKWEIEYRWQKGSKKLRVRVLDSPFIYPCGAINEKLKGEVKSCGGRC
jgi:hypothetical protein